MLVVESEGIQGGVTCPRICKNAAPSGHMLGNNAYQCFGCAVVHRDQDKFVGGSLNQPDDPNLQSKRGFPRNDLSRKQQPNMSTVFRNRNITLTHLNPSPWVTAVSFHPPTKQGFVHLDIPVEHQVLVRVVDIFTEQISDEIRPVHR